MKRIFVFFESAISHVGYMHVNSWQTINMPETPCVLWFEGCYGRRLIVFENFFIRIRDFLMRISEIQLYWFYKKQTSPPDGELVCYVVICRCALFVGVDAGLNLIHVGINASNSYDVYYVAYRSSEVYKVDRLIQSHLYRTDNLYVAV